uniref:Putative secreted protein n=1 Tax=Anopheles darlingi TaxID=43151 RepID=A0A2M4DL56_ANODA
MIEAPEVFRCFLRLLALALLALRLTPGPDAAAYFGIRGFTIPSTVLCGVGDSILGKWISLFGELASSISPARCCWNASSQHISSILESMNRQSESWLKLVYDNGRGHCPSSQDLRQPLVGLPASAAAGCCWLLMAVDMSSMLSSK